MSELSRIEQIVRALELAKLAQIGVTLTYFDVIELLGHLELAGTEISDLEEAILDVGDTLTARAEAAESALVSMVQQYCRYNEDEEKYSHDFMSAGEEAFYYLVERGRATWTNDKHAFIVFVKGGEG